MLKGVREAKQALKINTKSIFSKVLLETGNELVNTAKTYLKQRVYARSTSGDLTGTALGSILITSSRSSETKVEANTKFKFLRQGRPKNYSPFLNKNRKVKKLNTHYWDDAIKDVEKESKNILARAFDREQNA